uniref:F-box domain-containing protein n=1 Tax=Chenopodium quinoa TaxID=63459 RepID=A0A803LC29_CHEQI
MKTKGSSKQRINNFELLDQDILCVVFAFLDLFDIVRCSVVCKSWHLIISKSRLMHSLYLKQWSNEASSSSIDVAKSLNMVLEDLATRRHRSALVDGSFIVDQWKGHTSGYMDPEAMVGCADGTVRVFDMYSKSCSRIIRMHASQVNCLAVGEDQLVLSGSSNGNITAYGLLSDQRVASLQPPNLRGGIHTLCYNPPSHLVFAGSSNGYAACWDLRKMQSLWNLRVSPNAIYSMQHLRHDKLTLVVGGVDGVLRILDQNTGEILTKCVMDQSNPKLTSTRSLYGSVERRKVKRLTENAIIGLIPVTARPPVKCLAVGMGKVVTVHSTEYIRMWKFNV